MSTVFTRLTLMLAMASTFCLAPLTASAADTTLWDDLGGQDGVTNIVSGMFDYILADKRIAHTFENSNVERVEGLIVEQICELADGPCTYSGMSMAKSHRGLDLNMMHFNALVEDLQKSMRDEDVSNATQNRLLALLAPMKPDVVDPEKGYAKEKALKEAAKKEAALQQASPAQGAQ